MQNSVRNMIGTSVFMAPIYIDSNLQVVLKYTDSEFDVVVFCFPYVSCSSWFKSIFTNPWFVSRCLELCIKVMRKRLQRVGGTQNGKSELDGPSYAEFYQEHDGNLTLDVWWPNHE